MASLTSDGGKNWRIQVGCDQRRKTIRFRGPAVAAERFRERIARLVLARDTGELVEPELVIWLNRLPAKMYERLERAGLCTPRMSKITLGQLLDRYFENINVKPVTKLGYEASRNALIAHFGADTGIGTITALAAQEYRTGLQAKLAGPTVAKRITIAKHVFKRGVEWGMLKENPFNSVVAGSTENRDRQFFIDPQTANKVLAECPDAEWRLLFALSRWGGLRCPSEHLALRWKDIDWARQRFRVTCSKTAGKGKGERWVPIFPELHLHLRECFENAAEGSEWVITRYRDAKTNLRTQLTKIIKRAGLEPWQRLWHNLRSSRQTELMDRFPAQTVCAWIGNTPNVALRHYLQVREADFEAAVSRAVQNLAAAERKRWMMPAGQEGSRTDNLRGSDQMNLRLDF